METKPTMSNDKQTTPKSDHGLAKMFQDIIEENVFGRRSLVMPEQVTMYGEKKAAMLCAELVMTIAKEFREAVGAPTSTPASQGQLSVQQPVEEKELPLPSEKMLGAYLIESIEEIIDNEVTIESSREAAQSICSLLKGEIEKGAVAFAEWICSSGWRQAKAHVNGWLNTREQFKMTEQLYELYLQSLNQQ